VGVRYCRIWQYQYGLAPACSYEDTTPPRWVCPPGGDVNTTIYGFWNRDHTNIIPGDFDGDGKTDLIKQNDATTYQTAPSIALMATAPLPRWE